MSNVNFKYNSNINKLDCGSIYFGNKVNLSISNSMFKNNYSKSSGGVL